MDKLYLVLGGARSGKSRHALEKAESLGERPVFIATAEAHDDEMAARIAQHLADRGSHWQTIEAPLDVATALVSAQQAGDVCLVDCLTLWLSNLMLAERDIDQETERLIEAVSTLTVPVVLVSNEVGLGLVPETPLGRAFRDQQGRLNQAMARVAQQVEFIAAGLPLSLKS